MTREKDDIVSESFKMPGANCFLLGFTTSRYKRKSGSTGEDETIRFFKITTRNSEFHDEWRKNVFHIVRRYREDVDENFISQLKAGKNGYAPVITKKKTLKLQVTEVWCEGQISQNKSKKVSKSLESLKKNL